MKKSNGKESAECLLENANLIGDYDYFLADPARLKARIDCLRGLQSVETLERWSAGKA